jgi:hypothetical protein
MELDYAMLADSAQVAEGKTFILGGGISILYRQHFPAALGVALVPAVSRHPTLVRTPRARGGLSPHMALGCGNIGALARL